MTPTTVATLVSPRFIARRDALAIVVGAQSQRSNARLNSATVSRETNTRMKRRSLGGETNSALKGGAR
jgi:hypothetical protein